MRIALVSPLYETVPPALYGGTERVVANLCQGLEDLGVEVTLFASGGSTATTKLIASTPAPLRQAAIADAIAPHIVQLTAVARRAHDFDLIHNHMDYLGLPLTMMTSVPVLTTLHGRLDISSIKMTLPSFSEAPLVSISNAQRQPCPNNNWIATVHHGLDLSRFRFQPRAGSYLAFLGRISPEKRPDLAIDIARMAGIKLKIAAKVDPSDRTYFETKIRSKIDGDAVEFLGEIGDQQKSELLSGALGLVFPIDWPEPFGLVQIEAWACGTPVLARPYGSVPELNIDGVTGFVRESPEELARLVPALAKIDRRACRAYAEDRFSIQRMCESYIKIYRSLILQTRTKQSAAERKLDAKGLVRPMVGSSSAKTRPALSEAGRRPRKVKESFPRH